MLAATAASRQPPVSNHDRATSAYIVQADSVTLAATAVQEVGGKITHELSIIHAVGAILTAHQADALKLSQTQLNLYSDVPLTLSSGAEQYVRDEFMERSYSGDDGTVSWNGSWEEFGEYDGPYRGRIEVYNSWRCAFGYCLEMGGYHVSMYDRGVKRAVNLSGVTAAELTFTYRRDGGAGGSISLQASSDGTNWTTLTTYNMFGSDYDQVAESFDITAFVSSNTQIRFRGVSGDIDGKLYVDNVAITFTSASVPDIAQTEIIYANVLHAAGYTGDGVAVAVIDTGILADEALTTKSNGNARQVIQYDAINDEENSSTEWQTDDDSGHGSHVTSVIANKATDEEGDYAGVAPGVDLVSIKAFDANGAGSYLNVIRGLDWAIDNKDTHNIRVVNLKFGKLQPTSA